MTPMDHLYYALEEMASVRSFVPVLHDRAAKRRNFRIIPVRNADDRFHA
jgi:hypothetical protein